MFYFYFVIFSHLLLDIYIQKNIHINNFHLSTFNSKNIIFYSSFFSLDYSDSSESSDSSDSCPENCESCVNKTYCISCKGDKFYGNICENNCNNTCLDQICDKNNGTCKECKEGYFGINCSLICPEKCVNKTCDRDYGFCLNCPKNETYGDECDETCDETCKDKICYINGTCFGCGLNEYFGENKSSCINCSENCINKMCDLNTGECDFCIPNHYGSYCNNICNGCLYGCEKSNGDCLNNICINSFYHSQKCDQECYEKCQDKSCDMFTGNCVFEINNSFYLGKNNVSYTNCPSYCNDHSKYPYVSADCCLINNQNLNKLKNEIIEIYSYYNKNYDVHMINLTTYDNKSIPIVIDFNSNANLIIFTDHGVTFKNINDKKKINYNSSLFYKTNGNSTKVKNNIINYISGLNITGNLIRDNFTFMTNNGYINLNITFLDPISIDKVDHNYFFSGNIQGFVGLGILSQFIFHLYNDKIITNNIHSISNSENNIDKIITLGDYAKKIISKPEVLTNIKNEERDKKKDNNLKNISFVNTNIYQISLIGIYYNKKIYKIKDVDDNLISFDFNSNSSIILPRSFNNFFKLIYFGNYMEKKCSASGTHIIEYICDENIAEYLPDIGLYFQDYIYYIPKNIFFIEGTNRYKFLISLKEKTVKINIGKNFLYNYSLIFKNGFKNISFFNEEINTYKAYQSDIEMVDINNLSFNIEDSYGRIVSVFIFCFFGLIILIYLIYLCQKYQNYFCTIEDEDNENDSMLEIN